MTTRLTFFMLSVLLCFSTQANEPAQLSKVQAKQISHEINKFVSFDSADFQAHIRSSILTQREMMNAKLEAMSDPETAQRLARFSKVYFDALIKEGFSAEEAMILVKSIGIPSIN